MAIIRIHTRRFFVCFLLVITAISITTYLNSSNDGIKIDEQVVILSPSHLACQQPKIDSNSSKFYESFYKYDPLVCNGREEWVTIQEESVAVINKNSIKLHGEIECKFSEILRVNDDKSSLASSVVSSKDQFILSTSDFYKVNCTAADGKRWNNVIAGIRNNENIREQHNWSLIPLGAVKLNVLLLGFKSLSHHDFIRVLPKSYKFLTKYMKSSVMEGYNVVGDDTAHSLIPMLTGLMELELPETRKRMGEKAQFVDIYPFIWKKFSKNGYVTLFAEDEPQQGTFNFRLKGFNNTPVDHYSRPFYNYVYPQYHKHSKYCLSGTPRHQIFFNYIKNFFAAYKNAPKFAFALHSELSHDEQNLITVADKDLTKLLQHFQLKGHLEDTIVIMFSDHGRKGSKAPRSQQEKQEERLPFLSIFLPTKFKELYPSAADNIRVNSQRLSTPLDLHATLLDLTDFQGAKLGQVSKRAISFFSEISTSRTCKDASIEAHWCSCLAWDPLSTRDERVQEAASALLDYINTHTAPQRPFCHEFKLVKIAWAALLLPNEGLMQYKRKLDYDGFLPDLSDKTAISDEIYQIAIYATPTKDHFRTLSDNPQFEASITYNVHQDSFSVKIDDISRLNQIGKQPHCILKSYPHLSKFCYCQAAPKYPTDN